MRSVADLVDAKTDHVDEKANRAVEVCPRVDENADLVGVIAAARDTLPEPPKRSSDLFNMMGCSDDEKRARVGATKDRMEEVCIRARSCSSLDVAMRSNALEGAVMRSVKDHRAVGAGHRRRSVRDAVDVW